MDNSSLDSMESLRLVTEPVYFRSRGGVAVVAFREQTGFGERQTERSEAENDFSSRPVYPMLDERFHVTQDSEAIRSS